SIAMCGRCTVRCRMAWFERNGRLDFSLPVLRPAGLPGGACGCGYPWGYWGLLPVVMAEVRISFRAKVSAFLSWQGNRFHTGCSGIAAGTNDRRMKVGRSELLPVEGDHGQLPLQQSYPAVCSRGGGTDLHADPAAVIMEVNVSPNVDPLRRGL